MEYVDPNDEGKRWRLISSNGGHGSVMEAFDTKTGECLEYGYRHGWGRGPNLEKYMMELVAMLNAADFGSTWQ